MTSVDVNDDRDIIKIGSFVVTTKFLYGTLVGALLAKLVL